MFMSIHDRTNPKSILAFITTYFYELGYFRSRTLVLIIRAVNDVRLGDFFLLLGPEILGDNDWILEAQLLLAEIR